LLRVGGRPDAAAADYRAAIDLARAIGATTLLRRALSSRAGLERASES